MLTTSPKKIMLVKNRALGDSIMGLAAAKYLKSIFPDVKIIYALPSWIIPLYSNTETAVDEFLPIELNKLGDYFSFYKKVKNTQADYIFELHQSGRTAKFFKAFHLLNRTPYFFHNHHINTKTLIRDQGVKKALIQRDLDGLWSIFSQIKDHRPPSYLDFPPEIKIAREKKQSQRLVFGIVATRETKVWPIESFAKLAELIKADNPESQIVIPVSKSPFDQSLKEKLRNASNSELEFLEVPLNELAESLWDAQLYIGNDTGLKHLCVAMNIPTLTLFGPEPPTEWHPYNQDEHPYLYNEGLKCRTRTAHYCPLDVCDLAPSESMKCLKEISAETVFQKIKNLNDQRHTLRE